MGQPAAKQGDQITATDTHIVIDSSTGSPVPLPHPFVGLLVDGLSSDVNIMGKPAAIQGSKAKNNPPHVPLPPGASFQKAPSNEGTIQMGSQTVMINGKPAARNGDTAMTCNDPTDQPVGTVIAVGTVLIG